MITTDRKLNELNQAHRLVLNGREVSEFALSDMSLEETVDRLYGKLSASFLWIDETNARLKVDVGMRLQLIYGGKELFDGIIFTTTYNDDYTINVTAYNHGIYYAKNYVNKTFKKVKGSGIINTIINDAGLPSASVADTGYVIPEYVAENKTIQDVIYDVLEISESQTGSRYYPLLRSNKLVVAKYVKPPYAIVLSETDNMIAVTKEVSIENLANHITVIGGNKDKPTTVVESDAESIKKYGRMQMIDNVDEEAKPSHARDRAKALLKENKDPETTVDITAIGHYGVRAGTSILVEETRTGSAGEYVVESVTHSVNKTDHTMSLKLKAV